MLAGAQLTAHFVYLSQKKTSKIPVGPVMLGFFLFVVVGSGKPRSLLPAREELLVGCICWSFYGPRAVKQLQAVTCSLDQSSLTSNLLLSDPPCVLLPCLLPAALLQIIRTATTGQPSM